MSGRRGRGNGQHEGNKSGACGAGTARQGRLFIAETDVPGRSGYLWECEIAW